MTNTSNIDKLTKIIKAKLKATQIEITELKTDRADTSYNPKKDIIRKEMQFLMAKKKVYKEILEEIENGK